MKAREWTLLGDSVGGHPHVKKTEHMLFGGHSVKVREILPAEPSPELVQEMIALLKEDQASHIVYCNCKTCHLVAKLEPTDSKGSEK